MSKLTKAEYRLLDRMNKRFRTWEKNNISSEVINQVKNDLVNWYIKHDRVWSGENVRFTKSNRLDDNEKRELLQIARAMESAKSSKISYYKRMPNSDEQFTRSFETVRNNPAYGVNSFADYVRFVDDMKSYRETRILLESLPSKEVARLYAYGREHNLTTEQVNQILISNVDKYRNGSNTERFLMDEIDKFESEML